MSRRGRAAPAAARTAVALACLAVSGGCGTLAPGPRYSVTVDDFSFANGGSSVYYVQDGWLFYPWILRSRERGFLYRYDRSDRRHHYIGEADTFSASPGGPFLLYPPPWGKRFRNPARVPDFHLLDSTDGARRGYFMPGGFDRGYLSYGISHVRWEGNGSLAAIVRFYYLPGGRPSSWVTQGAAVPDWRTEEWRVRIDPARAGDRVAEASRCDPGCDAGESWRDMRARKRHSGEEQLVFTKYSGNLSFNSTLSIERAGGEPERIVSENVLIGVAQAAKYIVWHLTAGPVIWVDAMVR